MSERNDYFDFVTNVLGIKSVLLEAGSATAAQSIPLLISVEGYGGYSDAEKDLLAKMIGALKLDLQMIQVADASEAAAYSSEFTIFFSENAAGPAANAVTTFSPRYLLVNPDSKKAAWNDLQKAILFFKNPRP